MLPIPTSIGNACTCVGGRSHHDFVEASDIAFVGSCVAAFADPTAEPSPPGMLEPRPMIHVFVVDEPLRNAQRRAKYTVQSINDESACGVVFEPGQRYLVYATAISDRVLDSDTLYGTNLCQGSRAVREHIDDSLAVWTRTRR